MPFVIDYANRYMPLGKVYAISHTDKVSGQICEGCRVANRYMPLGVRFVTHPLRGRVSLPHVGGVLLHVVSWYSVA